MVYERSSKILSPLYSVHIYGLSDMTYIYYIYTLRCR